VLGVLQQSRCFESNSRLQLVVCAVENTATGRYAASMHQRLHKSAGSMCCSTWYHPHRSHHNFLDGCCHFGAETSSPTRKVAKAHLSSPFAPAQNTVQSVPLSRPPVGSASVRSNGKAVPAASAAPDKQQGDATGIPPESLESIDLTAGSDEDAT